MKRSITDLLIEQVEALPCEFWSADDLISAISAKEFDRTILRGLNPRQRSILWSSGQVPRARCMKVPGGSI